MSGEKFELSIEGLGDNIGQEVVIDDNGDIVETVNDNAKDKNIKVDPLLSINKEEIKDGDVIEDDDGEIKIFDSKKHGKKKKDPTEDNEEPEKTKNIKDAHQEEKKVPTKTKEVNSQYSPYAESLKEVGILPDLDMEEFNTIPEEEKVAKLVSSYKEGIDKGVEKWIESQPKVTHDILKALKEAGPYTPLMELVQLESEKMEIANVSEEDLKSDEDLQEEFVGLHLTETTRFSKEKIQKELVRLKASGELFEEAVEARKELYALRENEKLSKIEEAKRQKKDAETKKEEYTKNISEKIDKTKEIFPGIEINDTQRKELKRWMTEPVARTKEGYPISKVTEVRNADPESFDIRLLHYIQLGYFGKEINTSKLEKNITSKNVKKLADILDRTNSFKTSKNEIEDNEDKKEDKNSALSGLKNLDRMIINR